MLVNGNGKIVGVIDSWEIEVDGGDGDAGVIGKGDTSRRIDFLIDSGVEDDVWAFVCWSIVAKKRFDMEKEYERVATYI